MVYRVEIGMQRLDGNGSAPDKKIVTGAIGIVDPCRLRRECLHLAVAHHAPDRQVSEAADSEELLQLVADGGGFALVLICVAAGEGIDLHEVQELRRELPDVPVMVMAETDHPHHSRQILATGARGFVPASLSLKVVLGAVDLVLAGGVYVPSSLIDNGASRAAVAPAREPWSELTRRQRDVLALIAQGKSNKLNADALTMSESTVKAHVKQIIKRLAVANRTQAALVATGHAGFAARPQAEVEAARLS